MIGAARTSKTCCLVTNSYDFCAKSVHELNHLPQFVVFKVLYSFLCLTDAGFQALIQFHSRQEAVEAFGSLHVIIFIYCSANVLTVHVYPVSLHSYTNKNIPGKEHIRWLLPARHSIFKV